MKKNHLLKILSFMIVKYPSQKLLREIISIGSVKIRCPLNLALRQKNEVFRKLLKYSNFCFLIYGAAFQKIS